MLDSNLNIELVSESDIICDSVEACIAELIPGKEVDVRRCTFDCADLGYDVAVFDWDASRRNKAHREENLHLYQ